MIDSFLLSKESQKQRIIKLLIQQPNSSAKKIYKSLRKSYINYFTYQSVFKNLTELVNNNVLLKNNLKYSINPKWINDELRFFNKLKQGLNNNNIFNFNNMSIIIFNNLKEVNDYVNSQITSLINKSPIKNIYWKTPHCWWLISHPIKEEEIISNIKRKQINCKAIINSETILDEEAISYYNQNNCYELTLSNEQDKRNEVIRIIGNYAFTYDIPDELFNEMELIYKQGRNKQLLNNILRLIRKETRIELRIIRDKQLVEYYTNKLIKTKTILTN